MWTKITFLEKLTVRMLHIGIDMALVLNLTEQFRESDPSSCSDSINQKILLCYC